MEKEKNLTGSERVENKLNAFFGKNRKVLLIVGIVILAVIVGLCIGLGVAQSSTEKKFNALSELETQYADISAMDETSSEYSSGVSAFNAAADELISSSSLDKYPGAKATLLKADLAFSSGDYSVAADGYLSVKDAQADSYLASLAAMNAAACYENLGDNMTALSLYNEVIDRFGDNGVFAPKAMFAIGRLYDAMGETELARAEFETLTGLYLNPENGGNPSEYARMAEAYLINYAE